MKKIILFLFIGLLGAACSNNDEPSNNEPDSGNNKSKHEYVDLGLSVKWATCNVGASSPEKCGCYYAWGETEEKNIYTDETYKHFIDLDGDGSFSSPEEASITTDISGTEYDVAHKIWGGKWRMPKASEIKELCENCSWQWTSINGVEGYKVTGINGNHIFLPAGGIRDDGSDEFNKSNGYWSSTPERASRRAISLRFRNDYHSPSDSYSWLRQGLPVRPVYE